MFRKLALGLFAAASLGVLALMPTTASAKGWGWGGGFHHHHFGHFPGFIAYVRGYDDGCYIVRRVPTPFGYRLRTIDVCD